MKEGELTELEKKIADALRQVDNRNPDGQEIETQKFIERIANICIQEQIDLLEEVCEPNYFPYTKVKELKSQLK